MDQAKVGPSQSSPLRLWVHSELRKRELSRLPPEFNGSLNLRRPKQIGLLRRLGRVWHHSRWTVHVVATDLVFGTITAWSVSMQT